MDLDSEQSSVEYIREYVSMVRHAIYTARGTLLSIRGSGGNITCPACLVNFPILGERTYLGCVAHLDSEEGSILALAEAITS